MVWFSVALRLWMRPCLALFLGCLVFLFSGWKGTGDVHAKRRLPLQSPFFESLRSAASAMQQGDIAAWKDALEKAIALKELFLKDHAKEWSFDRDVWLLLMRYHFHLAQADCPVPQQKQPTRAHVRALHQGASTCLKRLEKAISLFQRYFQKLCGYRCLTPGKKRNTYTLVGVQRIQRLQLKLYLLQDYEKFLFRLLWASSSSVRLSLQQKKRWSAWKSLLEYAGLSLSPQQKKKMLRQKARLFLTTMNTFRHESATARRLHSPILDVATISLVLTLSSATALLLYVSILESLQYNLNGHYFEANLAVFAAIGSVSMIVSLVAIFALPDVGLYRKLQATHARYLSGFAPLPAKKKRRRRRRNSGAWMSRRRNSPTWQQRQEMGQRLIQVGW